MLPLDMVAEGREEHHNFPGDLNIPPFKHQRQYTERQQTRNLLHPPSCVRSTNVLMENADDA